MWNPFKQKPEFLFAAQKPEERDMKKFIGKTVMIDGKPVVIQTITGNRFKPAFFEINGSHLIGMLRFYAQMTGAKDLTEKDFEDFEAIEFHVEPKKSVLEK
jgi:hypothetical protein